MNLQVEELIPGGAHDHALDAAVVDLVTTRFWPNLEDVRVDLMSASRPNSSLHFFTAALSQSVTFLNSDKNVSKSSDMKECCTSLNAFSKIMPPVKRLLAHDLEFRNQRSPIFMLVAGDQGKLLERHWRHNGAGPSRRRSPTSPSWQSPVRNKSLSM